MDNFLIPFNGVLIEVDVIKETTASGIYIPESARKNNVYHTGKIASYASNLDQNTKEQVHVAMIDGNKVYATNKGQHIFKHRDKHYVLASIEDLLFGEFNLTSESRL
jgi:co-chaperonin GroES (HSP10)